MGIAQHFARSSSSFLRLIFRALHSQSRVWCMVVMEERSRLLLPLVALFGLFLISLVVEAKDLYQVLGVDKNASDREIQKAFHKLSLKYHPDKNKAKNAQAKFAEISNAYEVLSDSEKRKQYDLTGDEKGSPSPGFGGGHSSGTYGGSSGNFGSGTYGPGFGGPGPGGQRTFTFSYGPPNQEAQGGGAQGWQSFFTDDQYPRPSSNQRSSSGFQSEPGWAQNLFNPWTTFGNDRQNPSSNSRGRMSENFFGSSFSDAFSQSGGGAKGQGGHAQEAMKLPKGVEWLNAKKFRAQVLGTTQDSWAVLFFMPISPEISDHADVLTAFAEDLKGLLRVGAIDCEGEERFCAEQGVSFGSSFLPKLIIYPSRGLVGRSKPVQYSGEWTAKALKSFYAKQLSPLSTRLDHQNFIEAVTKTQQLPRAFFISKKREVPLTSRALSGEFENRIQFFDIKVDDETDPIVRKLGLEKLPGVVGLLLNGDQVNPSSNILSNKSVQAFRGFLEGLEKKEHAAAAESSQSEGLQTVTLLTQANMQHICGSTSSLCIIAVVKSTKQQKRAKEILTEISQKFLMRNVRGASPVSYSLVDGGKHTRFLKAFPGTVDNSSTILVAYKPRRGKFAVYRGPLTLEGVEEFLTGVLGGDINFKSVAKKPTLT